MSFAAIWIDLEIIINFLKKIETNDVEVHPFLGGNFFNFS